MTESLSHPDKRGADATVYLKGDHNGAHFEVTLGGIKIEVGGSVHVRTAREWHQLAVQSFARSHEQKINAVADNVGDVPRARATPEAGGSRSATAPSTTGRKCDACGQIRFNEQECGDALCAFVPRGSAASATLPNLTGWLMYTSGDGEWQRICRTAAEVREFIAEAMFCPVESADYEVVDKMMEHFRDGDSWAQWTLDWNFEDGGIHAVKLDAEMRASDGGKQTP